MKEFIYYDKHNLQIPLLDEIVYTNKIHDEAFLVSNSSDINCTFYAPEIDFYLLNSQDNVLQKAKNVSILYESRACAYDGAKDNDYTYEVGKNILLVDEFGFENELKKHHFSVITCKASDIEDINGHIGKLQIDLTHQGEKITLLADMVVWKNAPKFAIKQSGVFYEYENYSQLIEEILLKTGEYKYKNYIHYDSNICQYHQRREEVCAKCEEVCPSVAILKKDEDKTLVFSHIDCHSCGGCISVCPSGALDYSMMSRASFLEISKMYKDKISLIMPRKMFKYPLHVSLNENVLPFAIEGEKYLHEAHFMTLLQQSANVVIFFSDFLSKGTKDCISIINQITQAKYNRNGIIVCMNENELKKAMEDLANLPKMDNLFYDMNEYNLTKREIFSKRLQYFVGDKNLGIVKSGEHVRYGDVFVNENKCTLCLSCVDSCNVGALSIDSIQNSLHINASICTTCGYCQMSCPEDCMDVKRGEIVLSSEYFEKKMLAKDELFECIVCKKPYATVKAVQKIANIMQPLFKGDEAKIKSLYCCAECKPKVMFDNSL